MLNADVVPTLKELNVDKTLDSKPEVCHDCRIIGAKSALTTSVLMGREGRAADDRYLMSLPVLSGE